LSFLECKENYPDQLKSTFYLEFEVIKMDTEEKRNLVSFLASVAVSVSVLAVGIKVKFFFSTLNYPTQTKVQQILEVLAPFSFYINQSFL